MGKPRKPPYEKNTHGTLVVIGGGESKDGHTTVLDRFIQETGRVNNRMGSDVLIVPTAHADAPLDGVDRYHRIFVDRGAESVEVVAISTREEADRPALAEKIRDAAGVFFTGGDQNRIAEILVGTACGDAVYDMHTAGGVVGGTSAGASAMSKTMVAGGDVHPVPSRGAVTLKRGLGLIPGVIIDQHFSQRRRIGRLVTVISQNPEVLGMGVDENTAAIIGPGGIIEVVGEYTVTLFDGTQISHTNAEDPREEGPISVVGMKLHILLAGQRFHIAKRHGLGE